MVAKLKMQKDWPSPTWASQRAWLPNIWIFGGFGHNYTDIIGPWRMDYSYPVKDAQPVMIKNFKSPWESYIPIYVFGASVTALAFVTVNQEPYNPELPRDIYISAFIYDPMSIERDEEGNILPPGGYVAWNRIAADLDHINQFIGRLTLTTRWFDGLNGTYRYVDTVLTADSLNSYNDPVGTPGDFVTTAGRFESGEVWDITVSSS